MVLRLLVLVGVLASVTFACVPTTTITTTVPCCSPLTTTTILKIAPVAPIANYEQCSVLKRISSSCPTTGLLLCKAAPETNPTSVVVQAIDSNGEQIVSSTGGNTATLTLYCVDGVWKTNAAGTGNTVTQVSCSQTGSSGTQYDNIDPGNHYPYGSYKNWY